MPTYDAVTKFRTRWGRIKVVRVQIEAATEDDLVRQTQMLNQAVKQVLPGARVVSGAYDPLSLRG